MTESDPERTFGWSAYAAFRIGAFRREWSLLKTEVVPFAWSGDAAGSRVSHLTEPLMRLIAATAFAGLTYAAPIYAQAIDIVGTYRLISEERIILATGEVIPTR